MRIDSKEFQSRLRDAMDNRPRHALSRRPFQPYLWAAQAVRSKSPTFVSWLENAGLSVHYSDLFSMPRADLVRLYDSTFDRIEMLEISIQANKSTFGRLRKLRLDYMELHNISRWSDLGNDEDHHHIEWKEEVFARIETVITASKSEEKEVSTLERLLKLTSCILLGVHPNYESLRDYTPDPTRLQFPPRGSTLDEILGFGREEQRLRSIYDNTWNKYPRIDWADAVEEV